jgi:hypothetical protein
VALTHELDDKHSPIRRWFEEWLANTKLFAIDWSARVKGAATLRPETDLRLPGTVGTAFDYRLRYSLAVTPLDKTVAGLSLRGLASRGLGARAAGVSGLADTFRSGLASTLAELTPVGSQLADADEELLCRYCYVLALLEEPARGGLGINSPLYTLPKNASLGQLLALPPQVWLDDLRALSRAAEPHLPELGREPLVLNPSFAAATLIGGADADLVAGGCLIEIKTTVDPKFSRTRLLYQLLGYALLDQDDALAIDSVGVYLSRQSLLVRWPLQPLLETLLDGRSATIAELRSSFNAAVASLGVRDQLGSRG